MEKLIIHGQREINGNVQISGAKNAALPILISTILTSDKVELLNVPMLHDIFTTKKLLHVLGVKVQSDKNTYKIHAEKLNQFDAPYDLVKTMRASILVLGPLLARFGQARVSLPGGCSIGSRPVDIHIKGLESMGAKISINHGYIDASANHLPKKRLQGCKIVMDQVTVTGTENLMMAATLAEGITILENAAREPEVVDLGKCLVKMGAKIKGLGTNCIEVEGVEGLNGTTHEIMFDRIEAGTFMVAAAMVGGEITCQRVEPDKLDSVIKKLISAGVKIDFNSNSICVKSNKLLKGVNANTAPYPGFPTDMQAQFMAMNCVSEGLSELKETIFENRFMHVQELIRMGANIEINQNVAIIHGTEKLEGANVMATDLRASASLVLAGLVAQGKTTIDRIYHLDRGYESLETKFNKLGAKIERISS